MPEYFDMAASDVPRSGHAQLLELLHVRLEEEGLELGDLPDTASRAFSDVLVELGFGSALQQLKLRKVIGELQAQESVSLAGALSPGQGSFLASMSRAGRTAGPAEDTDSRSLATCLPAWATAHRVANQPGCNAEEHGQASRGSRAFCAAGDSSVGSSRPSSTIGEEELWAAEAEGTRAAPVAKDEFAYDGEAQQSVAQCLLAVNREMSHRRDATPHKMRSLLKTTNCREQPLVARGAEARVQPGSTDGADARGDSWIGAHLQSPDGGCRASPSRISAMIPSTTSPCTPALKTCSPHLFGAATLEDSNSHTPLCARTLGRDSCSSTPRESPCNKLWYVRRAFLLDDLYATPRPTRGRHR